MTTAHDIVQACKARGCRILWTNGGHARSGAYITVDHTTPTTSGSKVIVMRVFPGEIVLAADGKRYEWTAEQCAAVSAWVDLLHRMPLEEIP